MARYSALIVDQFPLKINYGAGKPWFRLPVQVTRVPGITNVYTNQQDPGGWIDASFNVPNSMAQRLGLSVFRRRTKVWMFDGAEPIFYGLLDSAVEQPDGDYAVTVDGMYKAFGETRMRECWGDGDTTKLVQAPGSTTRGSFSTTNEGNVVFGFSKGTALTSSDFIAADYFLFGEATGPRDSKRLTGFILSALSGNYQSDPNATLKARVYGMTSPTDGSPDLLYDTAAAPSWDQIQDVITNTWTSTVGYRNLRFGLYCTSGGTTTADRTVTFDNVVVSSRAGAAPIGHFSPPDISALVQDLCNVYPDIYSAPSGLDLHAALSDPNGEHGFGMTGNISSLGLLMGEEIFDQWSSPQEILEAFAQIADARMGMWTPTKQPQTSGAEGISGYQTWYFRPPELHFAAWPTQPAYLASMAHGAQWQPDGAPQTLLSAGYVNYTVGQHSNQQQRSVYVEDSTSLNYDYAQDVHEAADYTIAPPVGDQTAETLADQYVGQYRQPALSGTLTVYADRPGCIRNADGSVPARLGSLRTNVVEVVDAGRWRTGRVTQIEYYARDSQGPERAVLTINNPRGLRLAATVAKLADREQHRRPR